VSDAQLALGGGDRRVGSRGEENSHGYAIGLAVCGYLFNKIGPFLRRFLLQNRMRNCLGDCSPGSACRSVKPDTVSRDKGQLHSVDAPTRSRGREPHAATRQGELAWFTQSPWRLVVFYFNKSDRACWSRSARDLVGRSTLPIAGVDGARIDGSSGGVVAAIVAHAFSSDNGGLLMLPLTIYLQAVRSLFHRHRAGDDGEDGFRQAKHYRHRQCIYEKRAAYSLQRRRYCHRRAGARNRPQRLVCGALPIVVTILGWMTLIGGLAYLSIPHDRRFSSTKPSNGKRHFRQ